MTAISKDLLLAIPAMVPPNAAGRRVSGWAIAARHGIEGEARWFGV